MLRNKGFRGQNSKTLTSNISKTTNILKSINDQLLNILFKKKDAVFIMFYKTAPIRSYGVGL